MVTKKPFYLTRMSWVRKSLLFHEAVNLKAIQELIFGLCTYLFSPKISFDEL